MMIIHSAEKGKIVVELQRKFYLPGPVKISNQYQTKTCNNCTLTGKIPLLIWENLTHKIEKKKKKHLQSTRDEFPFETMIVQ